MVVNYKPTGRAVTIPVGLLIGSGFAIAWTLAGAMLTAKLVDMETIPENAIGYGALLTLLSGAFLASEIAYYKIKHLRAAVCMAMGAVYFLLLLAVNALFFGGQYAGVWVTGLVIFAGCGCAVLLGLRQGGGKKRSGYKIPKG